METIYFQRHRENPLDTLEIGRVEERRIAKYREFIEEHEKNLRELFSKYEGVKFQGFENVFDRNPSYSDPWDGVIFKFTIVSYPAWNTKKILQGEFETRMKSGKSFLLYLDSFNKNSSQFGSAEECYQCLEAWIKKFTEKPETKKII